MGPENDAGLFRQVLIAVCLGLLEYFFQNIRFELHRGVDVVDSHHLGGEVAVPLPVSEADLRPGLMG